MGLLCKKASQPPFCVQSRKRGNMNSFMSWVGGKKALRDAIVARLDERCDRYVEVFGGGGWVLFHKRPSKFEVYNDFNGTLVNLYRCVRDHPRRAFARNCGIR